jgi:DNA-binding SARP family transcriptional activator
MKNSALDIKITRPDSNGQFPRKRLFRKLDEERKRPIIWVSGPPGCGKTALVSSYLGERKIPCLWYQVERGDADIGAFFHHLSLAVQKAAPRKKKPLPPFTPESFTEISRFARRYFEEFYGRVKIPSVLVFDNFERLSARSTFVEVIQEGFSGLPRGVNAIVLSRSGPPPVFSRKWASNRMGLIGWKDLRMTLEETESIAGMYWKRNVSGETVRYLQSRSDGWVAGLVLLSTRASTEGIEPQNLSRRATEEIFDYFAKELYDRMGARTRSILILTAFFPSLTGSMWKQMTGYGNASRILSYLSHRHYFIETITNGEPSFRYHDLFREFLLSRARKEFSPAELSRIRKTASAILEESGQIEDAVSLLREDGEWEGLARVIQAHARHLIRQGRGQTLLEWMEDLPKKMVRKNPWLLYWMGICRLPFAPGESRVLFEDAFRSFRVRSDPEGGFLSWAGIVDSIVYGPGKLKILDPWFLTLAELRKNHPAFPSPEVEARVTCTAVEAFALRRPSSADMEKWSKRAMALARSTGDMTLRFSLLVKVARHCFHGGDFQAFGHHLDTLRGISRNPEITQLSRLELCWLEAVHANLMGEHDRCRKVVTEGLALSEATEIHLMDFLLMGHGALCTLHLGDLKAAEGFLRKMASALPQARPWEAAFYDFLASWEALHRGNQAHAMFHSDHCLTLCVEVGNPWTEALARLQRAFVLDRKGEAAEASRQLERAFRIGEESRMEFVRFITLLAKAYFSLRKGDEEDGLASLREGLRAGREKGYVDVYLWIPGFLERIAAEALERGIETDYVRDLVRKKALAPDGAIHYTEDWPWPLKIYTMGRFALVRDGDRIPYSRRSQQRPLQMLKALISMGGRNVSKDHLTEVLWADADGDMAEQSFTTTLSRLRKLLGYEKALLLSDGRLSLCNRHCWVDVWAFERTLGQADRASKKGKDGFREEDCARLVEKAIAIYQGPFLDGETFCSAIETSRERLRSKFLRCVETAGSRLEGNGQWEKALAFYQKGLEVEDLAEGFYRRQMICHQKLGQVAEGLAVYRRCKKTLASVLGVEPSSKTEAVYKSLLTR